MPGPPLPLLRCGEWWYDSSVVTCGSATSTMSPASPPLPPSGPPSGLNFSRWTETQPLPPLPARRCRVTVSTKVTISLLLVDRGLSAAEGCADTQTGRAEARPVSRELLLTERQRRC